LVLHQYYQSTDTSDSTINIITKGINFTNAIDNSNQLIIDNEGVFIKEIYRDNAMNTRDTGFKNLNDWMAAVEDMLITLGGFKGSGYTFIDLISDIIGIRMYVCVCVCMYTTNTPTHPHTHPHPHTHTYIHTHTHTHTHTTYIHMAQGGYTPHGPRSTQTSTQRHTTCHPPRKAHT
jgi:hypothetical protein